VSGRTLFAERGLHGVTTHDIARGAGVAAGTFYLHFKDKHALFRELVEEGVAELRARMTNARAGQTEVGAVVRAVAAALIGFAEDHRQVVRILFSGDSDTASLESDVLDDLARDLAMLRGEAVSTGRVSADLSPEVLAQANVGLWSRVIAWWAEQPGRVPREQVIETLARIQLYGTDPRVG
jgi:AcrR family transcriptional regulator